MREKLKRKLRSRRGMSLLLSLLLFLMCAVGGSVALTAGTASSGTVSERAKLDQRYFSVTSAAELLRQKFDNMRVDENMNVFQKKDNREQKISGSVAEFVKDQSLYLLSEKHDDWLYEGDKSALQTNAEKWLTLADNTSKLYAVSVASGDDMSAETLSVLNATVKIVRKRPEELNFIVTSNIERKNASGEKTPEKETLSLKIKYAASVLKEVKTTADGEKTVFQVNWEIGDISLAD